MIKQNFSSQYKVHQLKFVEFDLLMKQRALDINMDPQRNFLVMKRSPLTLRLPTKFVPHEISSNHVLIWKLMMVNLWIYISNITLRFSGQLLSKYLTIPLDSVAIASKCTPFILSLVSLNQLSFSSSRSPKHWSRQWMEFQFDQSNMGKWYVPQPPQNRWHSKILVLGI